MTAYEVPTDCCLQCGKSRAEVRDPYDSPCATAEGYEVLETLDEWARHHWRDWSDKELVAAGILPHAVDRYRRASIYSLPYAACEDTKRGHQPAKKTYPEFGLTKGRCVLCGVRGLPVHRVASEVKGP